MKIPTFTSEAVPTSEAPAVFSLPGERQRVMEIPKTEEAAALAKARVGDVMVDIAVKMREANDVDEISKIKSRGLEEYTNSSIEIQSPEFQKNNPMEPGEDLMGYYERHRKEKTQVINDKLLAEFNGSHRATKRAKEVLSDYDAHNEATISSFARAKKIEQMEFNLVQNMDNNSRAAINAYMSGDLTTYGKAIENAKTDIETNIAAGIVAGPRGEAMLKNFEKDVAIGVMSVEIDKAFTSDVNNIAPNKEVPDALTGVLAHIDKGSDPYLADPRIKADMRNLVEAKIERYNTKYEKHMREVREVWEVQFRQNMENEIDKATELAMGGNTQAFYDLRKKINGSVVSAVRNKILNASQAHALGEYYQKEASFSVYGRTIDEARENGNKAKLQELMKTFSAKPSEDKDPHLDEPIKRQLYNQAASNLEYLERRGSTKDYIAEGEVKRMLENAKMDARKNGREPNMEVIKEKIMGAFSNKDRAQAIFDDFKYDMNGEKMIYEPMNKALNGGPKEEAEVLGEIDAKVAAGGDQAVHAVVADQAVRNAIAQKREALNKDAVSYVYGVKNETPKSYVKDMMDKKPFDKVDAEMLLESQRKVGATPTQERLLTKSDADRIVDVLNTSKAEEAINYIGALQNYFGEHWNVVNKDLMKSKMPNEYHIAAKMPPGPDGRPSKDAVLLINTSKMNKDQVSESLGYSDSKTLNRDILVELQDTDGYEALRKSLRLQGLDPVNNKQIIDLKDSIHNLAVGYMTRDKMSMGTAVEKASEVIIDQNYNFASGGEAYRIPKVFPQRNIETAARDIKLNFSVDDIFDNGKQGYKNKREKEQAALRVKNYGYFINDEAGTGLILMNQLGHVASRNTDGRPKVFTWEELMKRKITSPILLETDLETDFVGGP